MDVALAGSASQEIGGASLKELVGIKGPASSSVRRQGRRGSHNLFAPA
jgi:hypothetical protein